jgi:urocanate hydratase
MLQNNLDPEVAERPDDLVVYGGTGRAARSWPAFDAMMHTMQNMKPTKRCWCSLANQSVCFARTNGRRGCC